jgi:hypothetical protein
MITVYLIIFYIRWRYIFTEESRKTVIVLILIE